MASSGKERNADAGSPANGDDQADAPRDKRPPFKLVRYGAMNWLGEFSHKASITFGTSTAVVIQTDRGIEIGHLVGTCPGHRDVIVSRAQIDTFVKTSGAEFCRPRAGRILREADDQDINENTHLNAHIQDEIGYCAQLAHELDLDMRIITAEHLLGGERIVFYFGAPGRIDFRQLVKQLAQRHRTRIEMRQVGARDEARLVADYEVCGRECCCRNFLKKLRPVNMKMAKLQKSTLDPSKVSGRCGRLRCCLRYEHVGYEELIQRLPRVGSRVDTEAGPATVLDRQILTQLVSVRTDDDRELTIPVEEIREFNLPPAPPKPEPPPRPQPRPPATPVPKPAPAAEQAPADGEAKQKSRRRRRRNSPRNGSGTPSANGNAKDQTGETPSDGPAAPAQGAPQPPTPQSGQEPPAEQPPPDTETTGDDVTAQPTSAAKPEGQGRRRRRGRRQRPRKNKRGSSSDGGTDS